MRRDQGGPPLIGGRTWLSGLAACLPVLAPPRIMLRLSPPGVPDDGGCGTAPPGCWPDIDWPALPGGGALGDRRRDRGSPGDLDRHGGGRAPRDRFPRRSGGHHPGCGAGQADGPPGHGGAHPVGRRRKDHLYPARPGGQAPEDRVRCVGVQQREGSAAVPGGNEQAARCPEWRPGRPAGLPAGGWTASGSPPSQRRWRREFPLSTSAPAPAWAFRGRVQGLAPRSRGPQMRRVQQLSDGF